MNRLFYILLFVVVGIAQTDPAKRVFEEQNYFLNRSINRFFDFDSTRLFKIHASVLAGVDSVTSGLLLDLAPAVSVPIGKGLRLYIEGHIQVDQEFPFSDPQHRPFYSLKNFRGANYYTAAGYLDVDFNVHRFRFGRFYDRIGVAPFRNLLLGNHDYHDGYRFEFNLTPVTLSTRFFQLAPMRPNKSINRYFYQHGIDWDVTENWSIGVHETAIASGEGASPQLQFLNPVSVYHENQLNQLIEVNTHYWIYSGYRSGSMSAWLELMIDDIQVDSEADDELNKEPTGFAFQFGVDYRSGPHVIYVNAAVLRNRVYNDPQESDGISYSKYIDHGKVMGYADGSNRIDVDLRYAYLMTEHRIARLRFLYRQSGAESVFTPFDRSYLELTAPKTEPIPFGRLQTRASIDIGYWDRFFDRLTVSLNAGLELNKSVLHIQSALSFTF